MQLSLLFHMGILSLIYSDNLQFLGSLTQAIRNFAKSLENWLKGAMTNVPDEMMKTKVKINFLNFLFLKGT
jgi:regulatory factor X 1/2/3